nr:Gag-Pol polyprotein [Tanacetum cinerariifolium]
QQPTEGELDLLFEAMYDDYFGGQPSAAVENVPPAQEPQVRQTTTASTTITDTVPIPTNSSSHATNIPITSQDVDELNPNAMVDGEPSRPVLTRNQLRSDGDMCMYALTVSSMEPKNVKEAMNDLAWIESMQEELLQFKWMDVWVLVPTPDNISPLTLKWIFKNKHDEEQTIIRNKSRLVVRGYRQEEGLNFEESFAPNNFFKGTTDPTLFIRRFHDDILVVQVYVDDIIFGSTHPRLQSMTSGQINSGLDLTYAPSTITTQQPTEGELDLLFEAMYNDYIVGQPSDTARTVLAAQEPQVCQTSTASTIIADTAPTPTNSSCQATIFPNTSQDVDELNSQQQYAQQQGNHAHL